jgi:trimethylamine---corrinoid protein Co-methyltransferase
VKPRFSLLEPELVTRILDEAYILLDKLGVEIHNPELLALLAGHGCRVDRDTMRARPHRGLVEKTLSTVPRSFKLHDTLGNETHDFSPGHTYFTPGSAALNILDYDTGKMRRPDTRDFVRLCRLVSGLEHIAAQSTAFIPADVPDGISDSYRLYLCLQHCEKPAVTGAFRAESFGVMRDLQLAVRGSAQALKEEPLCIFSCCPTSPLKWSDVTSQNTVDCARAGIPVEFIAMPLSGFMAPVTLVGTLIQHTAETLSGILISQLAAPGAPVLYGGSPAQFDYRFETTPMGAVETMLVDCAYAEIGRALRVPTQAYIGLSDAKLLDAQAGFETATGLYLAALAGINQVSGPGMLDFESGQSLEKLVLDNELCGSALRLSRGIEPREDFPSIARFEELLRDKHLLIAKHTRRHLRDEHFFPGPVIDRANRPRWEADGRRDLARRAHDEVEKLVGRAQPSRLAEDTKKELARLMTAESAKFGMNRLPEA